MNPVLIGDDLTRAMSRADGCPICPGVEPPRAAIPLDDGWRCSYLCADCGNAWTTDYRKDC